MSKFKMILLINLAILIAYTAIFCATVNLKDGYAFLGLMMLILLQASACMVTAIVLFIMKKNKMGQAFLLASGLSLVIGFSSCLGITSIV